MTNPVNRPKEVVLDWETYVSMEARIKELEEVEKKFLTFFKDLNDDPDKVVFIRFAQNHRSSETKILDYFVVKKEIWEGLDKNELRVVK